jgi:hypothetical protein
MLVDGHPDRYLDRIDVGDRRWEAVLEHPAGRVGYFLVGKGTLLVDKIIARYPALGSGTAPPAFLQLVHANRSFALYKISGT